MPDLNIGTREVKLNLVLCATRGQSSDKKVTVITEGCNYV